MTIGDGLAVLGGCLLIAVALLAAAWTSVDDRRERLRAVERLGRPGEWTTTTTVLTKRAAR